MLLFMKTYSTKPYKQTALVANILKSIYGVHDKGHSGCFFFFFLSILISFDFTGNNRNASNFTLEETFPGQQSDACSGDERASYLSASGGTVPWMMMISPGCKPPGMGPVYGIAWGAQLNVIAAAQG